MHRLSSRWTAFVKYIFPLMWLGALGVVIVLTLTEPKRPRDLPLPIILALPIAMAVLFGAVWRRWLTLVDEVWDAGNELVVKQRGMQYHIPISNILDVSTNLSIMSFRGPDRITLTLREPGPLGREISFVPPACWKVLGKCGPIVDNLLARIAAHGTTSAAGE